jgi:hypothetical protein
VTTASARPSRRPPRPSSTRRADDPSARPPLAEGDRPRIAPALQALAVPIGRIASQLRWRSPCPRRQLSDRRGPS